MGQKLNSLELGRFIAATFVMLSHVGPTVNNYAVSPADKILSNFDLGPLGVQYFFVLSGFVMASAHARDFGSIAAVPRFLWRRACRIYPVFWLAMLIPLYCQLRVIRFETALQLLSLVPIDTHELLPPAWTLRYEAAFYLAFSLCLLPYIGRPALIAWIITIFWTWSSCGILRHIVPAPPSLLIFLANAQTNHFFNFDEFYFFAGVIAGFLHAKIVIGHRFAAALLCVGVTAFVFGLSHIGWGSRYGSPDMCVAMGSAIASTMLALAQLETQHVLKISRYAGPLGAISYPLYILHWSMFWVATFMLPPMKLHTPALVALFVLGSVVIFAVAAAATFFFDQPIQRWLRGLGRRQGRSADTSPLTATER